VAQAEAAADVSPQLAPVVDHRVIDRLQGAVAVAVRTDVGPGLGGVVVDAAEHPHPAVVTGEGHGGVSSPAQVGPAGTMAPS
jgi:hypothetical protein